MRRAALALLLVAAVAQAQTGPVIIKQDGVTIAVAPVLDFNSGAFVCTSTTGGVVCNLNSSYGVGTVVGDNTADWAATVDMGTSLFDGSAAVFKLPQGTGTPPTGEGRIYWRTDTDRLSVGDGSAARAFYETYVRLGGDASDGSAFSWNGTTGCTCSGCTPSGSTCILTANAISPRYSQDTGTTLYSCDYRFGDFTLSGGTLTCGQSGAYGNTTTPPTWGGALTLRIAGTLSITGGTIDMAGKGLAGGAAGSSGTAGNRNGGAGGTSTYFLGGTAGVGASSTAAGNGQQVPATVRLFPVESDVPLSGTGGGGGAGSSSNGTLGTTVATNLGTFVRINGSTGGGGGYCTSSASTNSAGGVGGRGGGGIRIEYAGTWACAGATFNTSGSNGQDRQGTGSTGAGGGGGGGGSIEIIARDVTSGSDTCTYTLTGGTGGAAGTNCGAGGSGGAGRKYTYAVPQ